MSDTGFIFRASWPILDFDRHLSALRAEACADIDAIAAEHDARIVGDITWHFVGDRLVAQAPATPAVPAGADGRARHGSIAAQADHIEALAERGLTDTRIAALIGAKPDAVRAVRRRNRPAGDDDLDRARRRRELCDALDDTTAPSQSGKAA